mmetsp:Transcript_9142/g.15701  ORF Transcript_9142/g.15701 Transcript_9142/m.15701 type:complete len:274 (+) Transcript_9142:658-1479(+)
MKTMPSDSTAMMASRATMSGLSSRSCSSSSMYGRASDTFMLRFSPARCFPNILSTLMTSSLSGMPPAPKSLAVPRRSGISISTTRSSRSPLRKRSRKVSRVFLLASSPVSRSKILFSTASRISVCMRKRSLVRVRMMAASTRSRIIWSTSRPWNPTSVNFVASTLMNGASASFAKRRAISVFPQPVGPIMRMFLGTISSFRGDATLWRRHRFRRATATARFASDCPTMYLSSISTTLAGVIEGSSSIFTTNSSRASSVSAVTATAFSSPTTSA